MLGVEVMKKWIMDARVPLGMLMVQAIATGLQLLSRVILSEGTFIFALMAYRHVLAAFSVLPFALYWERGGLKKITFSVFSWLFMVALTGIAMAMGFFYYGLKDTTATYATNFLNLIPVITFIFSLILRIEKLGLQTKAGKIKTMGALLCFAGACVVALYKGKSFHIFGRRDNHRFIIANHSTQNWSRGTIFLVASCLSYGMWFILQVKLLKAYPYKYCATMLTCIIASLQTTIIGICIDRKPNVWQLGWNLQLLTIVYSGVLATAMSFCLMSWAISQRGPTYPSMFNPLSLILVAITEALFLGQEISIGSLIGMGLILVGLYSFLWAKHKELRGQSLSLNDKESEPASNSTESQSSVSVVPTSSSNT